LILELEGKGDGGGKKNSVRMRGLLPRPRRREDRRIVDDEAAMEDRRRKRGR